MFNVNHFATKSMQSLFEDRCAEMNDSIDEMDIGSEIEMYAQLEELVNA